jgi:hypothetical protein
MPKIVELIKKRNQIKNSLLFLNNNLKNKRDKKMLIVDFSAVFASKKKKQHTHKTII